MGCLPVAIVWNLFSLPAELGLLCYSPWYPQATWSLWTLLTMVTTPHIMYIPTNYTLGTWALEAGNTLTCELWECDGGPGVWRGGGGLAGGWRLVWGTPAVWAPTRRLTLLPASPLPHPLAGGCSPTTPTMLPNASAGDDILGTATVVMGAYRLEFAVPWSFTAANGSNTTTGQVGAIVSAKRRRLPASTWCTSSP